IARCQPLDYDPSKADATGGSGSHRTASATRNRACPKDGQGCPEAGRDSLRFLLKCWNRKPKRCNSRGCGFGIPFGHNRSDDFLRKIGLLRERLLGGFLALADELAVELEPRAFLV